MRDLNVFRIPLDGFSLERVDINNRDHIRVIKGLRDRTAKKMCFDVRDDIKKMKSGRDVGNRFLVKSDDDYLGYMYISNDHNNERVLSMIVNKKLRGKGYGKVILTGVSDYLLKSGIASSVRLYIKNENIQSTRMALACGFSKDESQISGTSSYSRRSK